MENNKDIEITRKIALLIDGDNAQPSILENILIETGQYGAITIRRIYGDWTKQSMSGWKQSLQIHAIQPIQQFAYTVGKNATDSSMIIDAMDLLHSHLVNSFCLVSSDSDYTRLATRIREAGLYVIGIGERKTPRSFVNACDLFSFTENLVEKEPVKPVRKKTKPEQEIQDGTDVIDPINILSLAYNMASREDDWAELAAMGSHIRKVDPSFDPRTYGYKKLSTMLKDLSSRFEIKFVDENGHSTVYVRMKETIK